MQLPLLVSSGFVSYTNFSPPLSSSNDGVDVSGWQPGKQPGCGGGDFDSSHIYPNWMTVMPTDDVSNSVLNGNLMGNGLVMMSRRTW